MNEKTKHTPGPWDVDYSGPARLAIIDPTGAIIALGNMQNHDGDVDEANARLIASAPELLEALEFLVHDYRVLFAAYQEKTGEQAFGWGGLSAETAEKAIAKARGENGGAL